MEIWDILDENGNKTGKTIDKADPMSRAPGVYHQGVDVWIINSENKILIQIFLIKVNPINVRLTLINQLIIIKLI